jgi:hypothetical protein
VNFLSIWGEGSVDIHFAVAILSESVLDMLDFSIEAFKVTEAVLSTLV